MKKTLLSFLTIALVCSFNVNSKATIHTVQVVDNQFIPATFNMQLGDTVLWVLDPGAVMFHTTTSQSGIPSGAVGWDVQLDNSGGATSYMYVPSVSGNYPYQCTFHLTLGMTGNFNVTPATSIKNTPTAQNFFISPNPAKNEIRIAADAKDINVELIDFAGRSISLQSSNNTIAGENIFFLPEIADGLYMVRIGTANEMVIEKILVQH